MAESIPSTTPVPHKTCNITDDDRNTSLHYAAAHGDMEEVVKETDEGHVIDATNYLGWTPLMMAARHGHSKVVQYLLEKHADSTRVNKFGFNVLLMAVACGKIDVLHMILQHLLHGGVSRQSMQNLFSPISLAVLFSNAHVVQYLIDQGFCINAATFKTGITPMMFATAIGNPEIINMLLSKGSSSNGTTASNHTIERNNMPVKQKPTFIKIPSPVLISQPQFCAQPPFINVTPNFQMTRKCSDLGSPYFTPGVSPLPPGAYVQQVFFPPNFSPSHFLNPVPVFSNDFLNLRIVPHSPFCSPVPYSSAY